MSRVLIWDLPTRLFHWLFAASVLGAALIALLLGEDDALFPYHAILGLAAVVMVLLRIVWGAVGSRYARFASWSYRPAKVIEYFRGIATGKGARFVGHNPASAYAILALLAMMLAQAWTGYLLARHDEGVESVHEVIAYAMLAVIAAHVGGVVIHTIRHRENITASMLHGRKKADAGSGIPTAHPLIAVLFLLLTFGWTAGLMANYDPADQKTTLPVLGVTLQLGEAENESEHRRERARGGTDDDHDEDHDHGEDDD